MATVDLPLQRRGLPMQVADEIEKLMAGSELHPGDRLPAERAMADQLGVSRPVIREAVKILKVRGLVDSRHGSGNYLSAIKPDLAADTFSRCLRFIDIPQSVEKVRELRILLEPQIARLAALRATEEDLVALELHLEEMKGSIGKPEASVAADMAFHRALAEATGNELFSTLLESITELLRDYMMGFATRPGWDFEHVLESHGAVVRAIAGRDGDAAARAMHEHLKPGYNPEEIK